jgi:hypothetical protein
MDDEGEIYILTSDVLEATNNMGKAFKIVPA